MARKIRSAIFLGLLGLLVLTVALWPQLLSYGAQYALRSAQSPTLKLAWSGVKGERDGVRFDTIDALLAVSAGGRGRLQALPVRISLSNVEVRPSIISALLNQQAVTFSANAFGGNFSGSVSGAFSSPSASVAWSHLDASTLALYPEVRALGVTQGMIEGTASFSKLTPGKLPNSVFSVTLRDFNIPNSSLTSILKLQPSDTVSALISGSFTSGTLTLEPVTITGPFGKLVSRGTVSLSSQGEMQAAELRTETEMSASESARFGAWLPLLTNNLVSAGARSFTINSKTVPCSNGSNLQTLRIGGRTLCFSNQVERVR